jgi:uncharacterized protein
MASAPVVALAIGGPVAVAVAWSLVRTRRATVWAAMGTMMAALGMLALVTRAVRLAAGVDVWLALLVGLAAGLLLYGATAAFMAVAIRWPPLARQARAIYDQRGGRSVAFALTVSLLLVVPGEELFWRGLVLSVAASAWGVVAGALIAWLVYLGANAAGGSIPILLGAIVGGAAWTALAAWSGGMLAALACHLVWTALMIVRPPIPRGSA